MSEIKDEIVIFDEDTFYIDYENWKLSVCVKFDRDDDRKDFDFDIDLYDFFHKLEFAPMDEWFKQQEGDELPSNELVYKWLMEIGDKSNKELYNKRHNLYLEIVDLEHYKYWRGEGLSW